MGKAQTAEHVSIDDLLASIRQAIHDEVEPPKSMPSEDLVKSDVNRLKAAMERRNASSDSTSNGHARRSEPPAKPGRAPMMPRLHRSESGRDAGETPVAAPAIEARLEVPAMEAPKTLVTGKREGFVGILGGDVRLEEALARLSRAGKAAVPAAELAVEAHAPESPVVALRPSLPDEEEAYAAEMDLPSPDEVAVPERPAAFRASAPAQQPAEAVAAVREAPAFKPNGVHSNGHAAPAPYVAPSMPEMDWPPAQESPSNPGFASSFAAPPPRLQPDLLSPAVSSSASMAFDRLAEALVSRSTGNERSLEEIARDMLRPLLKAWLDENLPTIVERLVREEIERVARRGGVR